MTVVYLLVALAIILLSAELFTNGIEWFGRRFELGEGAVGSVLAAVGTALPETLIPIIAILFTHAAARRTSASAPSSARPSCSRASRWSSPAPPSWSSTGAAGARSSSRSTSPCCAATCRSSSSPTACAMIAGALPSHHFKWILSPCLLVVYGVYVWRTMPAAASSAGETKPLYFHRHPGHAPPAAHHPAGRRGDARHHHRRARLRGRRCSTSAARSGSTRCSCRSS